jgi:Resolvase, N terminal domain
MTSFGSQASMKVTAEHLRRNAYLYVRQSTLRQVLTNTESTHRQYDLRGRAVALGWTSEQVIVIDTDQGQSGASATDRDGFQRLVAEVSMGRAGIVLGLEVSRLARNNADWHRLLEICALSGTLILDEDGLYDPCTFNDRLLLGLKGTMSEALWRRRHKKPSCTCSKPGCVAGYCPKLAAVNWSKRCRSGWSTTAPTRSSSTPTPACSRPCGTCSPHSQPPALRTPP